MEEIAARALLCEREGDPRWTFASPEFSGLPMIRFPVLTFLRVENYGLFPGKPVGKGVEWDFKKGLCLIAGINGLGKTTLLTMLLRVFSGPFDLTGDGLPERLESVIPESPILLRTRVLRYFAQRVADQGREATVTLRGPNKTSLAIHRRASAHVLARC